MNILLGYTFLRVLRLTVALTSTSSVASSGRVLLLLPAFVGDTYVKGLQSCSTVVRDTTYLSFY